jgi:hypothetical protein
VPVAVNVTGFPDAAALACTEFNPVPNVHCVEAMPSDPVVTDTAFTVPLPGVAAKVTWTPLSGGANSEGGCRARTRTVTGTVAPVGALPFVGVCGVMVTGSAQPMWLKQQVSPPNPLWTIAVAP